jgi:hypothetical protein
MSTDRYVVVAGHGVAGVVAIAALKEPLTLVAARMPPARLLLPVTYCPTELP